MKQESPPAWTQEAYHPPCSEYFFCCPNGVPPSLPSRVPPILTWLGGYPAGGEGVPYLGTPWQGTPSRVPPSAGYPPTGYPLAGYLPQLDLVGYPPGVCPMAFWEMLQSIMGYGYPPPVDRQIDGWKDRCVSKHYLPVVLRTRVVMNETESREYR